MYAKPIVLTRAVTAGFGAFLAVASLSAGAAKPGAPDACAAASDFPAFVYLSPVQRTRAVTLADTTGKCIRVLGNANTYLAPVLSYPISGTDTGRVVWHEAETIYAIDFTVAPDNGVTITVPKRPVAHAGCCTLDLSKDGKTIYFSDTEASLSAVHLDTGEVVWILPAPADPTFSHFINVSVNGNGSRVFATKMYVGADGGPDRSELVRVDVPGNETTVLRSYVTPPGYGTHNYQAEASKDSDSIAFVEYVAGSNNCTPLVVADSNGQALFEALETSKRYGTFPAWSGSNVLMIRRSSPDGSGKCANSDYITSVEPATSVETVLLKGWYPDGR